MTFEPNTRRKARKWLQPKIVRKLIVSVGSSDQQHVLEDYIEVHVAHASVQQKNDLHETLIWNTGQG